MPQSIITLKGKAVRLEVDPAAKKILRIHLLPVSTGFKVADVLAELSRMQKQHPSCAFACKLVRDALNGRSPAALRKDVDRLLDWQTGGKRDRIYNRLMQIQSGRKMSYGQLAKAVRPASSPRAVGQAMGANRFPLVIPCHRVVQADGSLGGFGGGLNWKKALLAHEGKRG